jgi:oligoribonuclease
MAVSTDNLIWIDLEMTGLDPRSDQILELATVITDNRLEILAEGPVIAIHQPRSVLAAMDEWNTNQHSKSGLAERVRHSTISLLSAELQTLHFLKQWVPPGVSPMCGNSICHDRRFLARLMPDLASYFHYRNLDVSTIKELARRWCPAAKGFSKNNSHLALEDIRESIQELRFYQEHFFNLSMVD